MTRVIALAVALAMMVTAPAWGKCTIEIGPPSGYAIMASGAGDNGVLIDGNSEPITPKQPYSVTIAGDCHDSPMGIGASPNVRIILHQWKADQ